MAKPADILTEMLEEIAEEYGQSPPADDSEPVDQEKLASIINKSLTKLDKSK
jgi:hypothetical protein